MPNPALLTDRANIAFTKTKEDEAAPKTVVKNNKKRKSDASDSSTSTKKSKKDATDDVKDLFSIALPGDDDGTVEIYDTCDELRRKINAALRTGTITKAALLRDMSRAAYTDAPNIQSKQLSDFLTKKGATSGSTSRVCYASYVYFEKKRIAEGKAKSKHRRDMEATWDGKGGLPKRREEKYWCGPGDRVVQDALGTVRTIPSRRF
ncbi:hypothetical protein GGX14DRAFT_461094 [Mycena pura]|uniref:DUF7726 domain-containing protein n=1 Tax=Mycena pura TaxID=153505 RepID=A0AAD6VD82_9AGAR|nr:hypothetical protein GGX14DRAFT_461094 [Mycena pura]